MAIKSLLYLPEPLGLVSGEWISKRDLNTFPEFRSVLLKQHFYDAG